MAQALGVAARPFDAPTPGVAEGIFGVAEGIFGVAEGILHARFIDLDTVSRSNRSSLPYELSMNSA